VASICQTCLGDWRIVQGLGAEVHTESWSYDSTTRRRKSGIRKSYNE
jgi:hypothetical protein